jgi:hypothetical protein
MTNENEKKKILCTDERKNELKKKFDEKSLNPLFDGSAVNETMRFLLSQLDLFAEENKSFKESVQNNQIMEEEEEENDYILRESKWKQIKKSKSEVLGIESDRKMKCEEEEQERLL